MFQLNVPKKTTALIQVWGSMLLLLIAVILSFSPIISLEIRGEEMDAISQMVEEITGQEVPQIPEKIDVSAVKLIGSINLITKVFSAAGNPEGADAEELEKMMTGEEGQNTIMMVAALVHALKSPFESIMDVGENGGADVGSNAGTILIGLVKMMVVLMCVLYMLFFTLIAPIFYIFAFVTALIAALRNIKTPEEASAKVGKKLAGLITFPMIFMLFQCVLPTMGFGGGALGLWILSIICVLLNVVVSRLRMYTPADWKYANVLQGTSLLAIVGFVVFFFNLLKVGTFNTFFDGKWGAYLGRVVEGELSSNGALKAVSSGYLIDVVLVFLSVCLAMSAVLGFKKYAQRISCTLDGGKKNTRIKDSRLSLAIVAVLVYVFPTVVASSKNCLQNPFDASTEGAESFLQFSAEQSSALTGVLVGALIMLVAEIALIVLKKVYCADMSQEDMAAVVSGCAKTPDEKLAYAEAIIADAKKITEEAAVAAAAEVVEETPVEEAAAEEAVAEEAVAESSDAE